MSKPSLVFVPGSFALPELYDNIFEPIKAQGYDVHALHMPSVGLKEGPRPEGPHTMADDAAYLASVVEKLADEDKDVVVMGHSYGGIPVTECVKGLDKPARQKQGKKGGIVRLAYKTCLVPDVGGTAMTLLAEVPEENRLQPTISEDGWMTQDKHAIAKMTFADLPLDEALAWSEKFPQHSAISFAGELTYAGYKDLPCSYLLCTQDLVLTEKMQRAGIERMEKASGIKVDVTEIAAGHAPSARYPEKVIEWILDVINKA